ncbi:MAG: cobalamin biosynthesis protein [Blautia sp.]|nr:cobalamin biosynthesis protein [Blautia sp.]
MRLSVISFTEKGMQLSGKIAQCLNAGSGEEAAWVEEAGQETNQTSDAFLCGNVAADRNTRKESAIEADLYTKCGACRNRSTDFPVSFVEIPVGEWAKAQMEAKNAMLFIGACGIAVRAIAPFLTDKLHDPPVLVMDEKGKYVIPILSGHMGGANELAEHIARRMGAEPVITTATDLNGKFAVDLFAKRNGLSIVNKDGIAKVSAKALAEQEITVSAAPEYMGTVAGKDMQTDCNVNTVRVVPYPPAQPVDIVITSEDRAFNAAILLRPREYVIGMGCRRGKPEEEIAAFIARTLEELDILVTQVYALASISLKRGEAGLTGWCKRAGVPFLTYTPEELREVKGRFTGSAFVEAQTGVDNVCERAALKACGENGKLILGKRGESGMTIAIAGRLA